MRIGFISEYFPPFAPGGAEWSTFYLAKDLAKKNIKIHVITPNFGAKKFEIIDAVEINRFPFKKLSKDRKILPEYYFLSPIWFLWGAWNIYKIASINRIDILHVHGKYSIPPARIANIFLRKKLLITIRDYQIICNYGFCIYNKNKACDFKEYFKSDFRYYYQNYVSNKNPYNFFINIFYALAGRVVKSLLKSFARNEQVVVLSQKQKAIFKANGFRKVSAINNSTIFPKQLTKKLPQKKLLFAGRLTLGKGVGLLMDLIPDFFALYPEFSFIFAGDGFFKKKLLNLKKTYPKIKIAGQIKHDDLNKLYSSSMLTVIPSVWQEPFGRVPLESIALGTPSVVTDKGGLPEIIKNNRWGYVIKADPGSVLKGIEKAIKNNQKLRANIKKDYQEIKNKFGTNIAEEYIKVYKKLAR